MSRLACVVVVVFALAASACVSAQAKGDPGGPALTPPAPPPHTIVPVEIAEEPAPPPAPPAPIIVRPTSRPPAAKQEKPADKAGEKPEAAAVPAQPAAPAPALLTTANAAEVERTIRARMAEASRDLDRTDYRLLSAERRAQYGTAKRFLQQADEALKVKNLVFAEQLADKAATLAAALVQR
jgi:hypothetical protein